MRSGKLGLWHDLAGHHVGQRHLGSWDQPAAVGGAKHILHKLGQLVRAVRRRVVDQQRNGGFLVAMLGHVQVDHPLAERALHPGQRAPQHREAGAGELGGGGEIHQPQRLAQFEMLLRHGERARAADLLLLHVGRLVGAVRNIRIQHVGQAGEPGLDVRLRRGRTRFELGHVVAQGRRLRLERCAVGAGAAELTDLLGQGVATGLALAQFGQGGPALAIGRHEAGGDRRHAPPGHGLVEQRGVVTDRPYVVHRSTYALGWLGR